MNIFSRVVLVPVLMGLSWAAYAGSDNTLLHVDSGLDPKFINVIELDFDEASYIGDERSVFLDEFHFTLTDSQQFSFDLFTKKSGGTVKINLFATDNKANLNSEGSLNRAFIADFDSSGQYLDDGVWKDYLKDSSAGEGHILEQLSLKQNESRFDTCCLAEGSYYLTLSADLNNNKVGSYELSNFALSDASCVSAVPEPSIYALMLAGLGLVGFMASRRKQA